MAMMGKKLKQLKKNNKILRALIRQNELRSLPIDQLADSVTALAGVGGGDISKSIDMEIKAMMSLQGILN